MNDETKSSDTITISSTDLTDISLDSLTLPALDTIDISSLTFSSTMSNGSYSISNGSSGSAWANVPYYNTAGNLNIGTSFNSGLSVKGDAEIDGDIKWKGRSLGDMLEKIESRLAILRPDPEKLEHFEALKKAYENYKTLERLCSLEDKDDKQQ